MYPFRIKSLKSLQINIKKVKIEDMIWFHTIEKYFYLLYGMLTDLVIYTQKPVKFARQIELMQIKIYKTYNKKFILSC